MNKKMIRQAGASAALLLAAAAYAQPTVNEDFGSLTNPTNINRAITISPSTVLWYKLTLPVAVQTGTATNYLDIRTHNGGATTIDTEMALYDSAGNFASGAVGTSFDDDDGPGVGSALSYGSNCQVRANGPDGVAFDGRDGGLPAGEYYIAICRYNATGGNNPDNFGTPWAVTGGTGAGGAMQLDVNYGTATESPLFSAAAATPGSGWDNASVLFTATAANCGSQGLVTTIDFSAIGGSATALMYDDGTHGDAVPGNNVFSLAHTIPSGTALGSYNLAVTGTNSLNLASTRNIAFNVVTPPATLTADGSGVYTEVEDNDTKIRANLIQSLAPGQAITGTTTGASTVTAGNGSADNFRIKTQTAPLGIYRHRITLNSATNSHTGTIRGLSQTGRVISTNSDIAFQTSSTTATNPTPARSVQWYGFGRQEELYYRVTGATATTAPYTGTYTREGITPVDAGTFAEGQITIDRAGHTVDVDFIVFDANFAPVPDFANDTPNSLTRTFPVGTYYLAWSNFNTSNDQPAASDDTSTGSNVLDFGNIVANSSTATSTNIGVRFTDVTGSPVDVPLTKPGFFDVQWVRFQVQPLTAPTNPRGTGLATPATAQITTSTLLTVTVTGGLNPNSTGLEVTGDLSSINGSSTQQFYDDGTNGDVAAGDNVFSFQATLVEPLTAGARSIPFTVSDDQNRTGTGAITMTLTAPPQGGCCTAGVCSISTEYNCVQGGGTYRGNGSDCGGITYTMAESPTTFSSISGTGTMLTTVSNCDDCSQTVTLPFSFNFFGNSYTSVGVVSNGTMQFVAAPSTAYQNTGIPAAAVPNNAIYPLWDDYNTINTAEGSGDIYTQELGTAPNRTFIIEWNNVTQYRQASAFPATSETFQVILHEGSNNIEFVYGPCSPVNTSGTGQGTNVDASGGDCTIGIENANGTLAYSIPSAGFNFASQLLTWVSEPVCGPTCAGNECGPQDYNGDGDSGTDQDIEAFFACLGGNPC